MKPFRSPRIWQPPKRRRHRSLLAGAAVVAVLAGGVALSQTTPTPPLHLPADHVPTAPEFLAGAGPVGVAPAADPVSRGRYLAIAGDCIACHTAEGKPPYSGGRGLSTPFGVIYSSNLTGDPSTGVGRYTPDTFWRALHEGKNHEGHNLYPALPYPYFTKLSRADSDALLAFLKTVPAVNARPPANKLPFPLNFRPMVSVWNWLFFKPSAWAANPQQSAAWNRGSYLVNVLGHCGACHTPKNVLSADEKGKALQGGLLDNWFAPNLTGQPRFGLGAWSEGDVVQFLKTGRNDRAHATGSMAEVVSDSTSLMTDDDLRAIAVYLKSLPAGGEAPAAAAPDARVMTAGAAIYEDACTGCHREGGKGAPGFFPRLAGHTGVQQPDGVNTVRVILEGARTAPTTSLPTPLSMPSFAWKLTDEQVADVATYVRNSWGNQAPSISPAEVRKLRDKLKPQGPREEQR